MGEYATLKRTGERVKLGTCEQMYYCTIKQRHLVRNYNFSRNEVYLWRLPIPAMKKKENSIFYYVDYECKEPGDGNADDWKYYHPCRINSERFFELIKRDCPESLEKNVGMFQLSHQSGLLINVPCYHGQRLPEAPKGWKIFWNGYQADQMRIQYILTEGDNVSISISCQYCKKSWYVNIEELEYIMKFPYNVLVDKDRNIYEERYDFGYGGEELFNAIKEEIADWMTDSPKTPKQEQKREYVFGSMIKFNSKSKEL